MRRLASSVIGSAVVIRWNDEMNTVELVRPNGEIVAMVDYNDFFDPHGNRFQYDL